MSIALDGNGNSVREGEYSLSDENTKRMADIIARAISLYQLPPAPTLSYLLYVWDSHLDVEQARRKPKE